ncbi:MAG: histidine kinase [Actinomycetota bacterium]|nr:histidine kinase [Actinomycetota bacterium]MDH5223707.1 histidine kinase [Actinomycetota bacterium]MDH5313269.1 histidine kinase [Actinomycetota bacterium]
MASRTDSLARPLAVFALLALLALALVAGTGVAVVRQVATDQALAEARQLTTVSARLVERRLSDELLSGDAIASGAMARIVVDAVLVDPIVRVKIWTGEGRIVYSDESRLIGSRYDLDREDLEVLDTGGVVSEVSDVSAPENRFERPFGELLEVYTRLETPGGTPLLFETYQRASSIAGRRRELASTFVPVLVVTLIALSLLMVPIAWILARRVRAAQRERERLMQRAIESSDRERRRIAGDLHDGPVQELAGVSMRLSASAEQVDDARAGAVLRDSASAVRGSVRTLRSAIVGVYPPNLQQVGLSASLSDLVARLSGQGIEADVDIEPTTTFGLEVDALLYRACQETVRNVEEHAGARHVRVSVRAEGAVAVLEVADDGRGIDPVRVERAKEQGHMGLEILEDLVADGGGSITVEPGEHAGTVVRVEVPAS